MPAAPAVIYACLASGGSFLFWDRGLIFSSTETHRMLEHKARRLAHPHRYTELLALRDCEVDILHDDHLSAVIEAAGQDGGREFTIDGAVVPAAGADRPNHDLRVKAAFGTHHVGQLQHLRRARLVAGMFSVLPQSEIIGRMRSTAAGSPETMTDNVPA